MNKKLALGARIKELREKRRMTQDILAELVGIDPKHLSRIENGRNYPSFETLEKLISSLNVSYEDVFKYDYFATREELLAKTLYEINQLEDSKLKFVYKILKEL